MSKLDDAATAAYEAIGYSIPYEMVEDAVRAALKVLRDPSDEMLDAAVAPYRDGNTAQFDRVMRETVAGYHHAMIDRALAP